MCIMLSIQYDSQHIFIICFIKIKHLLSEHITANPVKAYKSHFILYDYILRQQLHKSWLHTHHLQYAEYKKAAVSLTTSSAINILNILT